MKGFAFMWKCPVCQNENQDHTLLCTCGFEAPKNYEKYPVVSPLTPAQITTYQQCIIPKGSVLISRIKNTLTCLEQLLALLQPEDEGAFNCLKASLPDTVQKLFKTPNKIDILPEKEPYSSTVVNPERQNGLPAASPNETSYSSSRITKYLLPLVNQGNPYAQAQYGWLLENGLGVPRDYQEALEYYRKSALGGYDWAQKRYGWFLEKDSKNLTAAFFQYKQAAQQGDPWAQYHCGWLLQHNEGLSSTFGSTVPQNELDFLNWYKQAADQNYAPALNIYGWCLQKGIGCSINEKEAALCYKKAAEQGDPWAQYQYGWCLYHGIGTEKNTKEGEEWIQKSVG